MKIFDYILYLKIFIKNLSWKRLFSLFILILFSIFLILFIEFVEDNFFKKTVPLPGDTIKTLSISPDVKRSIEDFNQRLDFVVGVQIVTLNFTRNIRVYTYANIDSLLIQEAFDSYILRRITDTPIFDSDKSNNDRMIKILSGEFICVPYNMSTAYKYVPELNSYIGNVCAISIPPYNNEITGIITVYLRTIPTEEEKKTIFLFLRDQSFKIFEDSKNDRRTN